MGILKVKNAVEKEYARVLSVLRTSIWATLVEDTSISQLDREELKVQTVEGLTALSFPTGNKVKYQMTAEYVWMINEQNAVLKTLQSADIPVAVIKGTAAGVYYPNPLLRTYGDIDLLVTPANYQRAISILSQNGYRQEREIGIAHTAFYRGKYIIELHRTLPMLEYISQGAYISQYIVSGLANVEYVNLKQPSCAFPMLPWKQNGLILIWHIREHLYNGLGLRHIIDWMMFANQCLRTEDKFIDFRVILEESGLYNLAKIVTKMCMMYLGLKGDFAWCKDAKDDLCEKLMSYVFDQGNFGHKRGDDKVARVLSRYNKPLSFLKGMQIKGAQEWKAARKYRVLRPFAWIYIGISGVKLVFTREKRKRLLMEIHESRERREFFEQLYGDSK